MSFLSQFCSGMCSQVDLVSCFLRLLCVCLYYRQNLEQFLLQAPGNPWAIRSAPFPSIFWNSRGDWQSKPWDFPCLRANQGCWWMSMGNPTWIFCTCGFMGTLHFLCQSHRFIVRGWLLFFGSLYFQINGVLYFKCSWIGTEDNFPSLCSLLFTS